MQYDKDRFKVSSLPHPFGLFWVLNPVIMFNELIFGQRLPKVTLIDKESDKPPLERSYIPCPHCETLNDRRLWANGNAFGHWFGLVCPSCHQIIPCLWNIFSLAVLAITCPLWYFPVRFFRHRWIEKEKERLAKVLECPLIQARSINSSLIFFISTSFTSGVHAWVMWVIFFEVLWNGREWDLKTMLESLPIWIVAGFAIGLVMSWIEKDKEKEKERLANVPERPLIRAKSRNWFEFRWFVRGTFYFGGFMWVAFVVQRVLEGREWDLMFDMLPVSLLLGCIWGAVMQVLTNLLNLLDEPKRKKGSKT